MVFMALLASEWVTGCCSLFTPDTSALLEVCRVIPNRVHGIIMLVGAGPVTSTGSVRGLSVSKPALS